MSIYVLLRPVYMGDYHENGVFNVSTLNTADLEAFWIVK